MSEEGCKFGAECSFPHWKVEEQPNTKPKKGAVAVVRSVRRLGCVSQDAQPPESVTISRKGTKVLGPIRRVRFTRSALRRANIRDSKGPLLDKIQVKTSHLRSSYAIKNLGPISGRDRNTRVMRPRRRVETCQEYL